VALVTSARNLQLARMACNPAEARCKYPTQVNVEHIEDHDDIWTNMAINECMTTGR